MVWVGWMELWSLLDVDWIGWVDNRDGWIEKEGKKMKEMYLYDVL